MKTTKIKLSQRFLLATFAALLFSSLSLAAGDKDAPPPKGIPPSTNPAVGPPGAPEDAASPIEAMGFGDFK
ncbi:MAG: hypothetical protein ABIH66_09800, partial [bacterium]